MQYKGYICQRQVNIPFNLHYFLVNTHFVADSSQIIHKSLPNLTVFKGFLRTVSHLYTHSYSDTHELSSFRPHEAGDDAPRHGPIWHSGSTARRRTTIWVTELAQASAASFQRRGLHLALQRRGALEDRAQRGSAYRNRVSIVATAQGTPRK
jgi:hypothetical protein